ncbi:MAG: 5-methylthioadenosine/S-adenosylhomocysteine deaminase [Pseudomonadota bacterium]|nr:5-methylthioadenosine/S-adenosylhomocysteine deaminase [Pseudomonadota bacterium]
MESVDTLVSARWVMPVEPDGRVLEHHSVAIRSGRIEAVLPTAEARLRYDARETLDRPHHVLLPGLVNAHTHAAMVLMRGRAENLPLGPWLRTAVWPLERRWVDPEYVRDGTELAIAEMLRGGITCFADMHLWPDVVARTAAAAQMRASVGLVVTEAATSWATTADEYIDRGMRLRDEYKGDPLISTHFAPHSPYSASDGTLARVRRLADELDLPVAVHLHETAVEIEQSLQACGKRPLARLAALGLASPQLVAIHMTQVEPEDLDLLAEARASVVHCPESNLKLGAGVCPVARLLGRGIRVALGTDGAASNNDLDLLAEARIAGFVSAGVAATPGELIASDLVRMATLEGAQTLGLGEVTGSLVPGKWADLCCIDLRAPRSWPVHDVATAVIYAASSQQVTDTWVAGRRLLADGRLRTVDESAVLERAEAWAARLDATAPNEDPANG